MKRFKLTVLILMLLYLLYLTKSALGINLSQRYTAWKVFKLPVERFIQDPIRLPARLRNLFPLDR
ncbi:MAG: hypothetical protein SFW36_08145 [Leptolyngbyaceae cyanobacterium bins.59]|nr:hypothetical protein [Leptolyngbyaceae cyanobacterium bins.59]